MDQLKFKVSAELKNILGRDLITSDNIAIFELVKNSYDAHATKVEITFDEDRIVIADNGKGMSLDDIINKWLFVAYSAKRDGTEDASYRSKFKRNFAGAKGIGRLSCDRLARYLTMTTKSEDSDTVERIQVDWNDFEKNQSMEFDEIPVKHEVVSQPYLFPEDGATGTVLEFTGLHTNLDGEWDKDKIIKLRKSLEKMINPFSDTDDFKIEIIAPQYVDTDKENLSRIAELESSTTQPSVRTLQSIARLKRENVNGPVENSISDVLNLKTTQIESVLKNGEIRTTLTDRGELIYEISETSEFAKLEEVSVSIYYLNRAAKYSFSLLMGMTPYSYGNIFLFRNGFRIWPYGEPGDDSWGLDRRAIQGYNRSLSTRNLFGRVDVETEDVDKFKEVSSRDGGLIENEATIELQKYFESIHLRLERYVTGVLWGGSFLRSDYFKNNQTAIEARTELQKLDKDSDDASQILKNIGSKVDFLQLIKSLVNDKKITVIKYNEDLANIISDPTATELIQIDLIDDLKKVADKTNDKELSTRIDLYEQQLEEMRRQKLEAEKRAAAEKKAAAEARQKAEEEEKKRKEAEEKQRKAESELRQKTKQNLFLQSVSNLDVDRIIRYHHDIRIQAETVDNSISTIIKTVNKDNPDKEKLTKAAERIDRANKRILSIAKFATKANFNFEGDTIKEDLFSFIEQYINTVLPPFYNDKKLLCKTNGLQYTTSFKPLEVSLMIDNLLSNSIKASADTFIVEFKKVNDRFQISISDDGNGISIADHDSIFEKGVTSTNGSGIGLYSVSQFVQTELHGTIQIDESYHSNSNKKPGCKLIITI